MQHNTTLSTKPHYALLDWLRGVAAILVLFYHIFEGFAFAEATNGVGSGIITTLNHAHIAVDFFFILSGFVISYAYDNRWGQMSMGQFFKRRLIRLHPMLVMGAVLGFVAFALVGFERWDATTTSTSWVMIALMLIGLSVMRLRLRRRRSASSRLAFSSSLTLTPIFTITLSAMRSMSLSSII